MRAELFGEMREGWDGEVWEELGGVFEEDLDGMSEALDICVCSVHFLYEYVYVLFFHDICHYIGFLYWRNAEKTTTRRTRPFQF